MSVQSEWVFVISNMNEIEYVECMNGSQMSAFCKWIEWNANFAAWVSVIDFVRSLSCCNAVCWAEFVYAAVTSCVISKFANHAKNLNESPSTEKLSNILSHSNWSRREIDVCTSIDDIYKFIYNKTK